MGNNRRKTPFKPSAELKELVQRITERRTQSQRHDPHWDLKTTAHRVAPQSDWQVSVEELRHRFAYINIKHVVAGIVLLFATIIGSWYMTSTPTNNAHKVSEMSAKDNAYKGKKSRLKKPRKTKVSSKKPLANRKIKTKNRSTLKGSDRKSKKRVTRQSKKTRTNRKDSKRDLNR